MAKSKKYDPEKFRDKRKDKNNSKNLTYLQDSKIFNLNEILTKHEVCKNYFKDTDGMPPKSNGICYECKHEVYENYYNDDDGKICFDCYDKYQYLGDIHVYRGEMVEFTCILNSIENHSRSFSSATK